MLQSGWKTDKGPRRALNEDACLVMEEQSVYIVADGVGGNNAGEIASSNAVNAAAAYFRENPPGEAEDEDALGVLFRGCIGTVNRRIMEMAKADSSRYGMACTLIIAYVDGQDAYFVNVGDSRAYIYRAGSLFRVTEDHSYVNRLVRMGVLTRDEAEAKTDNHVITRAIGADADTEADYYRTRLAAGDVIILCSDGLYNEVAEDAMTALIEESDSMQPLAEALIQAACDAGGSDNITAVCIKVDQGKEDQNGK